MGGGLMQLVAYGAQDIYLTGNPQITFFKVVYRRHTNFSMESIMQTFNGTANVGGQVTATISRNGDLVSRMYVEFDASTIGVVTEAKTVSPHLTHALLKEMEIEIGGQKIDKHYGHWLTVWNDLTDPAGAGYRGAATNRTMAVTGAMGADATLYEKMSYNSPIGVAAGAAFVGNTANTEGIKRVPLQFWFCRNPGLALPLIALQYHEVKVTLRFLAAASNVTDDTEATNITLDNNVSLWADYIYLDTDERRRFAQVSHEYLIEQLQFETKGSGKNYDLNFNHPVKELIWTGVPKATGTATAGSATPEAVIGAGLNKYLLKLNGHDRFSERDARYFTQTQVWQHHSGIGGASVADSIAVYSFALKPEEHQPSGTCNFSRIDNAQLKITEGTGQEMNIYAVNYNVLRIMSGMGGLAYSN